MTDGALKLSDIHQVYIQGDRRLEVLSGADVAVSHGEAVGLVGQSGAGKSTLLHIAGLLERPTGGEVEIDGISCTSENEAARTRIRRDHIGFVYQFHHLLPEFTALENVILPQKIMGIRTPEAADRATELLTDLGLGDRLEHRPAQLSGGEQQRVALARALANRPSLLLADEPTGNLDEETSDKVMDQLLELVLKHRLAALIATHNMALARRVGRTLRLHNGQISDT